MPPKSNADRLLAIVDLDIAVVLASVVSDIRHQVDSGESELADLILDEWETALGDGVSLFADSVREIRGRQGYQAAAARFSLKQKWRRPAMEQFHYALRTRSRRGIDRWAWVARAYRNDLQEFVVGQQRILRNRELLATTQQNLLEHPPNRFRVLNAIALARHVALRPSESSRPSLRLHVLTRLGDVIDRLSAFEQRQHSQLVDRELWRARAEAALGDRVPAEKIARLPSTAVQTDAYRRLLHDEEQAQTVARAISHVARTEEQLAKLAQVVTRAR